MRIATLILGLVLMTVVGLQSCAIYIGGAALQEQATSDSGALGLFLAFLLLVGAAFVLFFPWISVVSFLIAGLVGLSGGSSTDFTDLTIWGIVAFVLAALSLLGVREKRRRAQSARVD